MTPKVLFDSIRVRLNNLAALIFASLLAYFFAFVLTNSVTTPMGAPQLEAPLFSVVFVSLLLTWIVSQFVIPLHGAEMDEHEVIRDATAIYVVSNGTGALTTTMTNLVEVVDLGHITSENAITVILRYLFPDGPDAWLIPYCLIIGTLSVAALAFVWTGATTLASRRSSIKEIGPVLSNLSGGLLALAMLVGVSWNTLPGDTSAIASAWGITIYIIILILGTILYGVLALRIIKSAIDLSIRGIVVSGIALADIDFWRAICQIAVTVFRGVAFAAGAIVVTFLAISCFFWAVEEFFNATGTAYQFLVWLEPVFVSALIFSAKLIALVTSVLCLWVLTRFLARRTPAALRWWFKKASTLLLACGKLIKIVKKAVRAYWAKHPFKSNLQTNIQRLLTLLAPSFVAIVGMILNASGWLNAHKRQAFSLVIAAGLLAASSGYFRAELSSIAPSAEEVKPEKNDPEVPSIQPEETPDEPAVPELLYVDVQSFSFCRLTSGELEWDYESTELLSVPVDRCRLPPEILADGPAVLFVAVSSLGNEPSVEIKRALMRGRELMRSAYLQGIPAEKIYMLNLGMGRYRRSTERLDLLGASLGNSRPALAYSLMPYPGEALLTEQGITRELQIMITKARLRDYFTNCDLYSYGSYQHPSSEPVAILNCG